MSREIIIELVYVTSKISLAPLWYCFDTLIQGRTPFCISELSSPDCGVAHCVPYSHYLIWKPKSKFIFLIYKTNHKVKQNNFMKFWAFLIYITSGNFLQKITVHIIDICRPYRKKNGFGFHSDFSNMISKWHSKFWFTVQVGKHRRYLSGKQARLDHFLCAAGLKSWNGPIISKVLVSFCIPSLIAMNFIIT